MRPVDEVRIITCNRELADTSRGSKGVGSGTVWAVESEGTAAGPAVAGADCDDGFTAAVASLEDAADADRDERDDFASDTCIFVS
jgi:hypothetical protein